MGAFAGLNDAQIGLISPDTWTPDWARLARPGNTDVQLDLFGVYQSNLALHPRFQAIFRERRPPTLIVWGEHDPFFTVAGARALQRDPPHAELRLLDAGHFALETLGTEITALMRDFLGRHLPGNPSGRPQWRESPWSIPRAATTPPSWPEPCTAVRRRLRR